jgi:sulfur carrier protein ThiS
MRVKIDIEGFPRLSEAMGAKKFEMNLKGTRINDVLDELIFKSGPQIQKIIYDEKKEFNPVIQVIRNGAEWIPAHKHHDTILDDGDTLAFVVLLAGG